MPLRLESVEDQRGALRRIAELIRDGCLSEKVREAAHRITSSCDPRDDECELEAIFQAVKSGTDAVPGLARGLRYVADPRRADYFTAAPKMLTLCQRGACAGDCDDATILVASLAGALGFMVGARAWGPDPNASEFTHVYPVAALPKKGPWPKDYAGVGMDTTVSGSYVGWEPKKAHVLTLWVY